MSPEKFSSGNTVTLLHCGAEFFPALLTQIEEAKNEIFLETYVFATDEAAIYVLNALKSAALRGVVVNLITDWIGTGPKQNAMLSESLKLTKVNHRIFNRWFLRGVARTHRKVCVIDGKVAFVGGININHDLSSEHGPESLQSNRWDFSVMVRGPVVNLIHREAEIQWRRISPLPRGKRTHLSTKRISGRSVFAMGSSLVAFLICDNFHNRLTIQKEYLKAINAATSYVLLANPYFAPGRTFRDALTAAAVRGVDVKLLLGTGQYKFQDWVARSYYRKLLASGVTLVEYKKTQLHAKVAVIDDLWVTVGSSNCDGLSLFVNHEANLVIQDHTLASALAYCIRQGILDGVAVDPREFMVLPWYKRMLYGIAFLLYRAAMRLITLNQPWN